MMKNMKQAVCRILIFLSLFCCNKAGAQTLPAIDEIKMEKATDFDKAEPFVLQTANYFLSSIHDTKNQDRIKAVQFIIKWMSGSPHYSFRMDETATRLAKGNDDVMGVYMAAMTKYVIENKEGAKDPRLVKLNAIKYTLDYCGNPLFKMKMTKYLKKLAEAREKGELEKMLDEEK